MAILLWAAVGGILAILAAWRMDWQNMPVRLALPYQKTTTTTNDDDDYDDSSYHLPPPPVDNEPPTVYVIGDLHGDVACGQYWVDRLQLADLHTGTWLQPAATLVFLGDYCDKGPYSFQTMHFVKQLTETFPDRVTALMGNHELELLRDRDPRTQPKYMQ